MQKISHILFALILIVFPFGAEAASVLRVGDNDTFAVDQMVEGDLYWAAETIVISGEVSEDLLLLGSEAKINGQIGADLLALAGRVDIDGFVGDDARVVAGDVVVSGEVLGDLIVLASNLKVLSTAKISGDLMFFGDKADISGEVGKSVLGTTNTIRIDGVVSGDVQVTTNELTLGERTDITGNVSYTSPNEVVRAVEAVIQGKVVQNQPEVLGANVALKDMLVPLLILLFAALIWYLLFNNVLLKVSNLVNNHLFRNTLVGFGVFFLTPIASLILLISTLGSFLGIMLIFTYLTLIFAAIVISGTMLGAYVLKLAKRSTGNITLFTVLLGTTFYYLLLFISVIGIIIVLLSTLATLGALATYLYRLIRS